MVNSLGSRILVGFICFDFGVFGDRPKFEIELKI